MQSILRPLIVLGTVLLLSAGPALAADHSGSWTKKNYKIEGTWEITGRTLHLKNFSTRNAPDLKIIFSPQPGESLNNNNALEGAVILSLLKSNRGNQSYDIPEEVDLSAYKTIAIHCQRFSKLWGVSPLN